MGMKSRPNTIPRPLSLAIHDLGANFFFAKYSFTEEPFTSDYHAWLAESYFADRPNHALRAVIEAIGLAGLSNVSFAARLESRAQEQYCNALSALKEVLDDPAQVGEDTTLMAVILLLLFELVNFKTWDRYPCWAAHVKAVTALLEIRGQSQFDHDRGGQLYIQSRSHILLACMQQCTPVPHSIVRTTCNFQTSATRQQWQRRKVASPGSISEISFRTINLRAALTSGEISDPAIIRATALDMDHDLESWRAGLPQVWLYTTVNHYEPDSPDFFDGQKHVYVNSWITTAWNTWRTLRILVKHIILENEENLAMPDLSLISSAVSIICELSRDICISVPSFADTPRTLSLIQPLYLVALTVLNPTAVRSYAVERLRHIASTTGVRQAALLADTAAESFYTGRMELLTRSLII